MPTTPKAITFLNGQASSMGKGHRLPKTWKQSISKLKKLLHIPGRQGCLEERDLLSTSNCATSPTNTIASFTAVSLYTIPEVSEITEHHNTDSVCLTQSITVSLNSLAGSDMCQHNSNALSVLPFLVTTQIPLTASSFDSPLAPPPERYSWHDRGSYDNVTTSTADSIFCAYEEEGITNDPTRIIEELEMYVPVTSAMVRILLTKSELFPGHQLDAIELGAGLKASCNEVNAFLSTWDKQNSNSLYNPPGSGSSRILSDILNCLAQMKSTFDDFTSEQKTTVLGSKIFVQTGTNVKRNQNRRSARDVLRSSKRDLKCDVTSLVLRIPGRGPRWLMDRVLLWTIVAEHEGHGEN